MNKIELINDHYKIICRPDLIEAVKRLPGRQYVRDGQYWTVPAQHARAVISFAMRHDLTILEHGNSI